MKKITIIITTKNSEEAICSCLEKVKKQVFQDIEILLLDSDSTDQTLVLAKEALQDCPNAKIFSYRNLSVQALRAEGLRKSSGEYILFLLPTDNLNLYACEVLYHFITTHTADLVIGSFEHTHYKCILENKVYHPKNMMDILNLQCLFPVSLFITGRLFKRKLLEKSIFPEVILGEELTNISYLNYTKVAVTTDKILHLTQAHLDLLNPNYFWKSQNSFWFKTFPGFALQESFTTSYERQFILSMEHLLFEMIAYKNFEATLEEITMELYAIFTYKKFILILNKVPHTGLIWKSKNNELLLTNCILLANFLFKDLEFPSPLSLFKIFLLEFIKTFYQQKDAIDKNELLGYYQEDLNLCLSLETKYIQQYNL